MAVSTLKRHWRRTQCAWSELIMHLNPDSFDNGIKHGHLVITHHKPQFHVDLHKRKDVDEFFTCKPIAWDSNSKSLYPSRNWTGWTNFTHWPIALPFLPYDRKNGIELAKWLVHVHTTQICRYFLLVPANGNLIQKLFRISFLKNLPYMIEKNCLCKEENKYWSKWQEFFKTRFK